MAYIPGKGRYNDYKSRFDVYLFTLRDYVEQLNLDYEGTFIERTDMYLKTGYLAQFKKIEEVEAYLASFAESSTAVSDEVTTYVLPATDGNDLPVYATFKKECDFAYIGLSDYPEALDRCDKKK